MRVNLNADLGEGEDVGDTATDIAMLEIVGSANIACGGHAGNASMMRHIVRAAARRGVSIGAHPGYPDREGFGRRPMQLSAAEIQNIVYEQASDLFAIAKSEGCLVTHLKAHGALYNQACKDPQIAAAIVNAMQLIDPELILLAPAGSALESAARTKAMRFAAEVFADRTYETDGSLTARSEIGAVITDPETAAERAKAMVTSQSIITRDDGVITQNVDSICVHGDSPGAVQMARAIRNRLLDADVELVDLISLRT